MAVGFCVGVSTALILGAHGFERIVGLEPCLLCLDQREAHWTAIAAGGICLILFALGQGAMRIVAATLGVMGVLYLFSGGLASYHAGVEWGFWPGPEGCAPSLGTGVPSGGDILTSLENDRPRPSCSEAAWRLFGLSMAGYNALVSFALAGLAATSCFRLASNLRRARVGPAASME